MAALSSNTIIDVVVFKNRLKERLNEILPTGGYSSSNLPNAQMSFLVTTRESLLGDINAVVNNDTTLTSDTIINSTKVFNLIKQVFVELGRCRKVYYHNAQNNPGAGTTQAPSTIANNIGATNSNSGTFTYFKSAFSFTGNYASPTAQANSNTNVEGYKTIPEINVNNWQNNTRRDIGTTKIPAMSVNSIIKALQGVEQQMTTFGNDWSTRNGSTGWWSGIAGDTTNSSNRVFFVRYWCHSNCHSDCHSSCHGSRGRR